MGLIKELFIIVFIYLLGEGVAAALGTAFPGSVVGMLILLALLHAGIVKVEQIGRSADFLLKNMPFFFIPAGVSIMASYTLLEGFYLETAVVLILSTFIVMALSALVVECFARKKRS